MLGWELARIHPNVSTPHWLKASALWPFSVADIVQVYRIRAEEPQNYPADLEERMNFCAILSLKDGTWWFVEGAQGVRSRLPWVGPYCSFATLWSEIPSFQRFLLGVCLPGDDDNLDEEHFKQFRRGKLAFIAPLYPEEPLDPEVARAHGRPV